MPSPTDFNLSPFFDDFNENKKFHRVLFRPAFAVQARELTQSQTLLQNQIERFGDHMFKHGAMVIPGSVGLNLSVMIGNILFGQKGIFLASLAWILPSIIIITFLSKFIFNNTNKFYKSFVNGIFLCTIALILHTLLYILKCYDKFNIFSLIMLIIV